MKLGPGNPHGGIGCLSPRIGVQLLGEMGWLRSQILVYALRFVGGRRHRGRPVAPVIKYLRIIMKLNDRFEGGCSGKFECSYIIIFLSGSVSAPPSLEIAISLVI